jgi:flagellar biosynthetic protein FliP
MSPRNASSAEISNACPNTPGERRRARDVVRLEVRCASRLRRASATASGCRSATLGKLAGIGLLAIVAGWGCFGEPLSAQEGAGNVPSQVGTIPGLSGGPKQWTSPEGLSSTLQVMLMLTVISLAPAVMLMTTSFIRIVVVLGLVRQALGTQQLPPSQVITSLAMFISLVIMTPVWSDVYNNAIEPYTNPNVTMSLSDAWREGVAPVRRFMSQQIDRTGNDDDVLLFLEYLPPEKHPRTGKPPKFVYYGADYEKGESDVPLQALIPAFMLSELKTAFLIGFQIYLPFLILDVVVSSVTISMGMMMLPPVLISLPFKILLFVLLDGWHLVVKMLLESFQAYT